MKLIRILPTLLLALVLSPTHAQAKPLSIEPDKNFNGIRDDMDQFIKTKPNLSAGQRNALAQITLVAQKILHRDTTKDSTLLALELNEAEACLFSQFSSKDNTRSEIYAELLNRLLNTPALVKQYEEKGNLPNYKAEYSYVQIDKRRCTYSHY